MMPNESLQDKTGRIVKHIAREGYNPFHLLQWKDLLSLFIDLRWCIRRKQTDDPKIARGLLKGMWKALVDKAEDMDMFEDVTDYTEKLDEIKNN